jgi:hypothetical protein
VGTDLTCLRNRWKANIIDFPWAEEEEKSDRTRWERPEGPSHIGSYKAIDHKKEFEILIPMRYKL